MIPKPTDYHLSVYPLRRLRGVGNWSGKQFRDLRAAIRRADERHLDQIDRTVAQSPAQWAKFRLEIVTLFPEINDFEDDWVLFTLLSSERKLKKHSISTRRGLHSPGADRCRYFVGKPLPRRIRYKSRANASTNPPIQTGRYIKSSDDGVSIVSSVKSTPNREWQMPGTSPESNLSNDRTACTLRMSEGPGGESSGNQQAVRHPEIANVNAGRIGLRKPSKFDDDESLPRACLPCGSTPDMVHGDNTYLKTVLGNKMILIDALAGLGIVDDSHLFVLDVVGQRGARACDFFDSLPKDTLPMLHKVAILNYIRAHHNPRSAGKRPRVVGNWFKSNCPDHPQVQGDQLPPKLRDLLNYLSMDELAPLFFVAHVRTDDEFEMLCELNVQERLSIFNGGSFARIRPFQRWLLRFVLEHLDILDPEEY
ncbi:hypothetical protein DXG01_011048 [Tephrocybe rancida]|nr:hypothetical protein DXG01_011048 [Tephrocybe rancida]